jgi:hypothetical protein
MHDSFFYQALAPLRDYSSLSKLYLMREIPDVSHLHEETSFSSSFLLGFVFVTMKKLVSINR